MIFESVDPAPTRVPAGTLLLQIAGCNIFKSYIMKYYNGIILIGAVLSHSPGSNLIESTV